MSKVITLKFFLQKTNNQLQTHSPKLSIAQQTLKNKDKGLVMDKGQLTKLQVEHHGLSVQVTQDEQVAKKRRLFATWIQWFEPVQLEELEQYEDLTNQTWPIDKRLQEDGPIKLWTRNKPLNVLK